MLLDVDTNSQTIHRVTMSDSILSEIHYFYIRARDTVDVSIGIVQQNTQDRLYDVLI